MYIQLTQLNGEKVLVNVLGIMRLRRLEGEPTDKTLGCNTEVIYLDGSGLYVQEKDEDINEQLSKIFFE